MKTKATGWTPGPWKLGRVRFEPDSFYGDGCMGEHVMLSAQDGTPILASQDAENYASSIKMMREVDARLIAAAPEMAELLERNQGIIMNALTSGHGLTPAIMADMREAFAAIRALLAKIKGEQNV